MSTLSRKVIYTGRTHISGGREGAARSSDGELDVRLKNPGGSGAGTNPEQLLGAGWSACFLAAIGIAARERKIAMPADAAVDAEVDLRLGDDGYTLATRLTVSLPGLDRGTARELVDIGHRTCPYSKALHGNMDLETRLL
jgi:Ohr subfamily peroxiredoxin